MPFLESSLIKANEAPHYLIVQITTPYHLYMQYTDTFGIVDTLDCPYYT